MAVELFPNNEKGDLLVSAGGLAGCAGLPNSDAGWVEDLLDAPNSDAGWVEGLLGAPNIEIGSVLAGGAGPGTSAPSSIDSAGGLGLLDDDTISSKEPPRPKAPEEESSGLSASLAAVASGLNEEPSTKPSVLLPKGFLIGLGLGANGESPCG